MKKLRRSIISTLKKIDSWWFPSGNPLPLAILRCGIGVIAFFNFCLLMYYQKDFYSESGMTTSAFAEIWGNHLIFNLLRGETLDGLVSAVFISGMVSALFMSVGLFSRLATVLTAVITLTIQHRNPFIIHSGDILLKLVLIYMCFARSGAAFSFDILWRKKKPENSVPLWPQRLIAFQLAVMYFGTVFEKLLSVSWREGSAMYFVLRLEAYHRFPLPEFLTLPPMTVIATYAALIIEFSMGLAVFSKKIRNVVWPFGVCLHLGIIYTMNIPLFCELTILLYVSLFSANELKTLLSKQFLKPFMMKRSRNH
jgi:hypothetical protein